MVCLASSRLQRNCQLNLHYRFDITPKGQQVHIAFGPENDKGHPRHPCFRLESPEALLECQKRVWEHYERGDTAAPMMADKPGERDSGKYRCPASRAWQSS